MDTLYCARMNLNSIEEHERFDDKLEDNHCDRNDFNGNDNLRALDWEYQSQFNKNGEPMLYFNWKKNTKNDL